MREAMRIRFCQKILYANLNAFWLAFQMYLHLLLSAKL